MIEPLWLDILDICDIHNEVINDSGGSLGILNEGALESTLSKPRNLYFYSSDGDLYKLAASYGYGLTKNHCFIDGNKRTAFITAYTFLLNNGIKLIASNEDATKTFLELAASFANQEEDLEKLCEWLRLNSMLISD
jgi:death-on-curing protein